MDERTRKLLELYGLSSNESLLFFYLLGHSPRSAGEISRSLQLGRMEAYRILKKLSAVGIIIASPSKPVKYSPEPVEQVISISMEGQMKKLKEMEEAKDELLSITRAIRTVPESVPEHRFRIIQGREQIYGQMEKMIDAAESSLELLLTRNDLIQLNTVSANEKISNAAKRGVKVRIVTVVDSMTLEAVESVARNSEVRHSDDFSMGRMIMGDESQIMVSLVLDDSQGLRNKRDVAIWTDSESYANMIGLLFQQAFSSCVAAKEKIREIKSGKEIGNRFKAIIEVLRATLPVDGWQVTVPGNFTGASGRIYELSALLTAKEKLVGVEIVLGPSEPSLRDSIISSMMKGLDIKNGKLIVIASPYSGDDLPRLANLIGVTLLKGSDTVNAVAALRKVISGG